MTVLFGNCVLDTEARRLVRGQDEIHLAPKAFELLKLLIESRPRALGKTELLEQLWPGVFVSEASLAKVVSNLREALGHDEDAPIIRTVHGYGYAFAATVIEPSPTNTADTRSVLCWLFCGPREFPLPDGEHIVGREPDASVSLDSPKVSRRHARLTVSGSRAVLEDLESKNGSFVRGARVTQPAALASGDEIRIGPFTLTFRISAGVGSTVSER
ncbi:MAG TPA: FHA domain-containing protein [Vicinamibacterales bacterium]|nr:FHA domain-containing protein [Vicinamibacterales bacterium]